jgi:hypothetical protein
VRESGALYPADQRSEIDAWLGAFARREPIRIEPGFP